MAYVEIIIDTLRLPVPFMGLEYCGRSEDEKLFADTTTAMLTKYKERIYEIGLATTVTVGGASSEAHKYLSISAWVDEGFSKHVLLARKTSGLGDDIRKILWGSDTDDYSKCAELIRSL